MGVAHKMFPRVLLGYVSYPRTESSSYPSSFVRKSRFPASPSEYNYYNLHLQDFVDTLQQQRGHPEWGRYADQLLSRHRREEFPNLARKGAVFFCFFECVLFSDTKRINLFCVGVDVGDHPPITPVSLARPQIDLTGDEERVYALIVKHFLATISGISQRHMNRCVCMYVIYCLSFCIMIPNRRRDLPLNKG